MDSYCTVENFSSLEEFHVWWLLTLTAVRVDFVWRDDREERLLIFLIDQNRQRVPAIVPRRLMQRYISMDLVGRVFRLEHFRLEGMCWDHYPRYERYSFDREDWTIYKSRRTSFIPLMNDIANGFPLYPLVPTIRFLARDGTRRKMLIDVVGKIIDGSRFFGMFILVLQDATAYGIKLIFYDNPRSSYIRTYAAIRRKSVIFVSRVKLIHRGDGNFLRSTNMSNIVFQPHIPEAEALRDI